MCLEFDRPRWGIKKGDRVVYMGNLYECVGFRPYGILEYAVFSLLLDQ